MTTFVCSECKVRYPIKLREIAVKGTNGSVPLCRWCHEGKAQAWCAGISSECADGMHVLFWDFDDVPLKRVKASLYGIQGDYILGDMHILNSSPGENYQAVCFTKEPKDKTRQIISGTPDVDEAFAEVSQKYRGHHTLRWSAKRDGVPIKWWAALLSPYKGLDIYGKESLAHWVFYANLHKPIQNRRLEKPDGLLSVVVEGYRSRHVGEQHVIMDEDERRELWG